MITFLSWDTDAKGRATPKVVSWDTRTGAYGARPLAFPDGTKLDFDDFGYVVQDAGNGRLNWVYADGRVFTTDIASGETAAAFNTNLKTGARVITKTIYAFTETQLHAVSTMRGTPGYELTLHSTEQMAQ